MLFVGDDWAADHHDVDLVGGDGRLLGRKRFSEGVTGLSGLHSLIADHLPEDGDPADVIIRIRDRPRSVGAGVDRRRIHRVRREPVTGSEVSGTAWHVGVEERPG